MNSPRSERAVALLLAVAVLCVLATLGVTLVRTASIERASSGQYVLAARAREMCTSGVAYAVERLRAEASVRSHDLPNGPWTYGGEDLDGDGVLSLPEDAHAPELGRLDGVECPLEVALAPSFPHADNAARLAAGRRAVSGLYVTADGSFGAADWDRAGFSLPGGTSPAPAYLEASFALKVVDCAAQLDANGGRWTVDSSGALVVATVPNALDVAAAAAMVDALWRLVAREAGLGPDHDLDATLGKGLGRYLADVLDARGPGAVFATAAALEAAVEAASAAPGVGAEIWRRVEPYVTCHPWRDPSVVRPSPRPKVPSTGRRTYTEIARAPRAPVNVNTADWKVLAAAWSGLSARYSVAVGVGGLAAGTLYSPDETAEVALSVATAEALAKRLVAYRHDRSAGIVRPFAHAGDLDLWLDGEVAAGTLTVLQAMLVRVQAHPDAQLVSTNPDLVLRRPFDKTDLVELRTELTYASMGRFEIEVIGRVSMGTLEVARSALDVVVQVYGCEIDTDYRDFERGEASLAADGAATIAIHPGVSSGAPSAFATTLPVAGASGSAYDGRVGLAPTDPDVARPGHAKRPVRFHADFALAGDGDPPVDVHPLQRPLVGSAPPGTRFVDGAYGEYAGATGAYPVYERKPAGKPRWLERRGGIAFWYKPNWAIDSADERPHSIATWNGTPDGVTFQLYFTGRAADRVAPDAVPLAVLAPKLVLLVWDSANLQEAKIETSLVDSAGEPITGPGQWIHLCVTWDKSKVVFGVRSRFKDRGAKPPMVLKDDTGGGGPITLVQPMVGGAMGVAHWVVDPELVLPPLPGGKGRAPPKDLAKPTLFEMDTMRLGGPLKTRAIGGGPALIPPVYDLEVAPSEGTYANLWSLDRPDASDPAKDKLATVLADPVGTLVGYDLDHGALDALYRKGRYHNGDDFVGSPASEAFGRFRSRVLPLTRAHPLGTITWRSHTTGATSLVARILREGAAGWEEVPDPKDPSRPLSFYAPGSCAIPRAVVDMGLASTARWGAIRYQFHFVETIGRDSPLLESPFLESVVVTVLSPPEYVEWCWRTR